MRIRTAKSVFVCAAFACARSISVGCGDDSSTGDPCLEAPCDPLATCTPDGADYLCDCPAGYDDVYGDGTECAEIDECAGGLDDCDPVATCTNTDGGWTCECPAGHTDVNGDGTQCEPPTCTAEGDSHAISPSAPDCCTDLVDVGCDEPDGSGGCTSCTGSSYCTDCGDGVCGPGENECRCPADCP